MRQPYAWLIVAGIKRIENRSWSTRYRGPLLIHAALRLASEIDSLTRDILADCNRDPQRMRRGGIIGTVELIDCVTEQWSDPFFTGPFGFVLANPRPCRFRPCRGRLGLFTPERS